MKTLRPFSLISTAVFFHLLHVSAASASSTGNPRSYIRSSCDTTLYPDLCYFSLVRYANAVQQDPARLARAAIGVSLFKAKRVASYISNLTSLGDYGPDPRAAAALHDCFSVFGDAVDQIRGSMKQMRRLRGERGGEELLLEMNNVQTWMSAALTNEDTCTDGFEDVDDGPMKMDVCDRAVRVKEVTSNALALVNSFVAKVTNTSSRGK